jgi:hypothetical protein
VDGTLARVFRFLGVDDRFRVANREPRNVSPNRTDVPPEVIQRLDDYYRQPNRALEELLGEEMGW